MSTILPITVHIHTFYSSCQVLKSMIPLLELGLALWLALTKRMGISDAVWLQDLGLKGLVASVFILSEARCHVKKYGLSCREDLEDESPYKGEIRLPVDRRHQLLGMWVRPSQILHLWLSLPVDSIWSRDEPFCGALLEFCIKESQAMKWLSQITQNSSKDWPGDRVTPSGICVVSLLLMAVDLGTHTFPVKLEMVSLRQNMRVHFRSSCLWIM